MKKTFLFSVLAAALLHAGCASAPVSTQSSAPLRVASYNIRLSTGDKGTPNAWPNRKNDLVALIRKLDLDAFGLQEVKPDQAEFLDKSFPDYAKYGEHRGADRKSDAASSIYFRTNRFECVKGGTFWLSETPDVPGLKGWGAACPRVCSWALLKDRRTGKQFCFANTHTDHVSALARKEGMLLIIKRMKEFAPPGTPIVFTGDHNCRETEEPAQAVSKILKNALYCAPKSKVTGPWRTFSGWKWRDSEYAAVDAMKLPPNVRNARKGSPDADKKTNGGYVWEDCGARIDYIYVSPGVKVKRYATHADPRPGTQLYPSDHFPVTAEIVL